MPPIRPEDHAYRFRPAMLRELREQLKLTQAQMADLLEIPVNTLSRWELGSNMPDANALAAIYSVAAERGVTPQFFEERRTPMTEKANRQNIVVQWDYQNFPFPKDIIQFESHLLDYLRLMYQKAEKTFAKAYTSDLPTHKQFINSVFDVNLFSGNVDESLIRDAETIFGVSVNPLAANLNDTSDGFWIDPLSRWPNAIDAEQSVYVLISNDGGYAKLLLALKEAGADVFVCGNAQCSGKLIKAVGNDRFIPVNRPYIIHTFLSVANVLFWRLPTTREEFAHYCKRAVERDGWDRFPPDTGFGKKHPYARARDYMDSMGFIEISKVGNDPNRIRITTPNRS